MRHVIIAIVSAILGSAFFQYVNHSHAAEAKKEEPMVCVTNADLDKVMKEKGYSLLLSMVNEDNIVETVWTGGQSISITAAVPSQDKSCLLAVMKNVTFNPNAIEGIWEVYKKQTKQKDI